MRTLLALALTWLMPAKGKHRATPSEQASMVSTTGAEQKAPVRRLLISPSLLAPCQRNAEDFALIAADGLPLVRPYLIACGREQERLRQRYEQRAAMLAPLGQDCPAGVPA